MLFKATLLSNRQARVINIFQTCSGAGVEALHEQTVQLFFFSFFGLGERLDSAEHLKEDNDLHLIPLLSRSSELW